MTGSFKWLLRFKHQCPCALGIVTGLRSVGPRAYFLASGKAPPCRCQRNAFFREGGLARSPAHYWRKRSAFGKNSSVQRCFQNAVSSGCLPPLTISTPTHAPILPLGQFSNQAGWDCLLWTQSTSPQNFFARTKVGFTYSVSRSRTISSLGETLRSGGRVGSHFQPGSRLCSFLMNADQLCTNVARTHAEYSHEM